MANMTNDEILDAIGNMTVLELADFVERRLDRVGPFSGGGHEGPPGAR